MLIFVIIVALFYITAKVTPRKKLKRLFLFYAVFLAILAFFYTPGKGVDLNIHYYYINNIRAHGFQYIHTEARFEGLYIYQLLFFVISRMPVDNFLPAITAFIVYYLPLKVVLALGEEKQFTRKQMLLLAAFILCTFNFGGIISNIRSPLAYSICIYVMYYELKNKKYRVVAFLTYILLCFLHQSVIAIVMVRVAFGLANRYLRRGIMLFLLLWYAFINPISEMLRQLVYIAFFDTVYRKILAYMDVQNNAMNVIANEYYMLMIIQEAIFILFLLYLYFVGNKYIKKGKILRIDEVMAGMIILTLGSVVASYHYFLRFAMSVLMFSPHVLARYLESRNPQVSKRFRNVQLLRAESLAMYGILLFGLVSNYIFQYRLMQFSFTLFN